LVVVDFESTDDDVPGQVTRLVPLAKEAKTDLVTVTVVNQSDIQISVTTHMHFFEANPRLRFDRAASYGRHLYIPAGEHVDFPPGVEVSVNLIPITGNRILIGFAGLVDGPLDAPGAKESAIAKARSLGYLGFES
jgi:urease subunit gamma/beta